MTMVKTHSRGAIAIALMCWSMLVSVGCGLHFTPGIEAKEDWTRRYTLKSGGSLEIRNTNGRIKVRPGDGDAVEIVATRVARGDDEAAAKRALDGIQIRETASPTSILLDSTFGEAFGGVREQRQVHYVVTLPRRANLTLKATNGDIDLDGVTGTIAVESTNGRIKASGVENQTKVETGNGEVVIDVAKLGGAVTCDTTNGRISVTIPRDAKAELSARVTNGAISHSNLELAVKETSRRRLDASIGGGGPEIKLETTNGAIEIRGR